MSSSARGRRSGIATTTGTAQTPARGPNTRTPGAVSSSHRPTALPRYQPLVHPLSQDAIIKLRNLPQSHRLDGLKRRLARAINTLTEAAGDVNDRYQKKLEGHRKWKARHGDDDEPEAYAREKSLQEMKDTVDEMTSSIEEGIRKMIDAKATVDWTGPTLNDVARVLANDTTAPTQSTLGASQHRRNRQRDPDSDSSDNEEPTWPQPLDLLKRKMSEQQTEYEKLSKRLKYSENNDYIGFRKIVHDARHPEEDAKPLPHPSTWFPDPASASGPSSAGNEDADLEVASERISTKCPITLLPMQDPVSSKKCPHSFEKQAIMGMINASRTRLPGPNGMNEKAVRCPVCEVYLTPSNLFTDPVLVRKIARAKALEADSEEDSDSDIAPTSSRNPQNPKRETTPTQNQRTNVKPPPASPMAMRTKRDVSMIPNTQLEGEGGTPPPSTSGTDVLDLDGDSDEEEEGEEEEDDDDDDEEEDEEEQEEQEEQEEEDEEEEESE